MWFPLKSPFLLQNWHNTFYQQVKLLVNFVILFNSHSASACIYISEKISFCLANFSKNFRWPLDGHLSWKGARLVCSIDGSQWSYLFNNFLISKSVYCFPLIESAFIKVQRQTKKPFHISSDLRSLNSFFI